MRKSGLAGEYHPVDLTVSVPVHLPEDVVEVLVSNALVLSGSLDSPARLLNVSNEDLHSVECLQFPSDQCCVS